MSHPAQSLTGSTPSQARATTGGIASVVTLMHDGSGKAGATGTWGSLKTLAIDLIEQLSARLPANRRVQQSTDPANVVCEFSESCRVIGRWRSEGSNRPASPTNAGNLPESAPGNNNLLEYSLHWEAAPSLLNGLLGKTPTSGSVGFEHYLNCLHRDDMQGELQSIRAQMLNRQTSCISRLRMRIDNAGWTCVEVRRDMSFASGNGELTGFTLTVAVDLSQSVRAE